MLQNDASQTGTTDARNDLDVLHDQGPATGNAITGAGTVSGAAGADVVANGPATIVAVNGVESSGGPIQVEGAHGTLVMQSDGSYTYTRKEGVPDGVSDVFTYTLADSAGARDDATLTIDIRGEEEEQADQAQNLVTTQDGVVLLPAGVELSDIRVVGRDLVITLPDGSTMTIPGGAVFVPQLVIGDVEVPPTNLAALLIEQEPQPAAGTPQSSGGNFGVDVPPLDPGVPLGDLLPPTEFGFPEPVFEEVGDIVNRDPEIRIQPEGQPASVNAVDSVGEAGLPERNEGEPAGTGEVADGNGTNNSDPSETTTGLILIDSPDEPNVVTITGADGEVHVVVEGLVIEGEHGTLTITDVNGDVISYSYTLADNTDGDATHDDFSVSVTDADGDVATATLTINIVDDEPIAENDTDSIPAGEFGPATGNVLTDDSAGDTGDSDDGADTVGADDAELTAVTGAGGTTVNANGDFVVEGGFGTLTISADGSYSYVRNPGTPGGGQDVFTYTLTDGDGDTDTATLTIDIGDETPSLEAPATAQLDDDALAGGNPGTPAVGDDPDSVNTSGNLSASGGDGDLDFFFSASQGGLPEGFTANQVDSSTLQILQGGTVVLTVTLNNETGAYTVVQNNPIDHEAANLENNAVLNVSLFTQDSDGDQSTPVNLTINVDDDTPVIERTQQSPPTLLVDETDLAANASGDFSGLFDVSFGADGVGSAEFSLSVVNGTDSGRVDVATGDPILLFDNNGVIEGRVGGEGGAVAFTVSVDSETGVVTLDQVRALAHPNPNNPDETVSLAPNSIQLTVTATDGDGDPVSETVDIGGSLSVDDDGPAAPTLSTSGFSLAHDETPGVDTDADDVAGPLGVFAGVDNPGNDPHVAGAVIGYAVSTGAISVAAGADFGADGEGSTTFALAVSSQGADSGLNLTDGTSVFLFLEDGIVVGRAGTDAADAADNPAAFALAIDPGTGIVSMVQYLSLQHPNPANPDEAISIANGAVLATATITDGDGDPATGSIAIGGLISFQDDAPNATVVSTAGFSLSHDETPGDDSDAGDVVGPLSEFDSVDNPGNDPHVAGTVIGYAVSAGAISVAAGGNFGADGPGTTTTFALAVSSQGADSGLDLTDGTSIFLFLEDGIVVGRAGTNAADAADNPAAFALAIDSGTGQVSMVQYLSIAHPTPGASHDEPVTIANGAVLATATVTDGDNDPATGSVAIGGLISFQDDGPNAQVANVATDTLVLDETTPPGTETDGDSDPAGLVSTTADFSNNFATVIDYGADGPAASDDVSYSLVLTGSNVASGLFALDPADGSTIDGDGWGRGAQIVINQDPVTGVITGTANGQAYFTISIDSETGVVTFTQLNAIWHPAKGGVFSGFTDTGADDDTATLTAVANSLVVRQTVTDGDGDTDSADIDLSSGVFQIEDDGPVAVSDVDAIVSGGDSADGNVITGVGTLGGTADDAGADSPGHVVGVLSVRSDGSSLGTEFGIVPGGPIVIQGEFGELTMNPDGSYTYARDPGSPGNAQDVFKYILADADGDRTVGTLTIVISDEAPVLAAPPKVQLDDDNALSGGGNPGTPEVGDDALANTSGTLSAVGGDGDIDFFFSPGQSPPAGFGYTVSAGAGTQTLTILQLSTGLVVATVTLNNLTGSYTVVQNNPVRHDTLNNVAGDNTENNTPDFNVAVFAEDVDGSQSDPVNLVINFDDDTPVLTNVAAGVGVTLDETSAVDPDGFPISAISASAAITATQAFGADGAAAANSVVYGLSIIGGSPELTTLRTAVGDHLITLVQVDANTIQGQYNGANVAFTIDIGTDGKVTLTQEVPLEHTTDGSSAAAHDDALNLAGLVSATITITDSDGDSTSASAPIGNGLIFRDDGPDAQLNGQAAGTVVLDETRAEGTDRGPGASPPNGTDSEQIDFSANFVTGASVDFGADGGAATNDVTYALVLTGTNVNSGLFALDGTDTLVDGDGYGQGSQIVLNQTGTNTITGSANGTNYFTITIDPATGIVTFTQLNNIWHPTPGTASFDEAATLNTALASAIRVLQKVTDSDGDFDTAELNVGRGVFVIQDDGPQAIQPQAATVEDSAGEQALGIPLDDDGSLTGDFGTDLPGRVTFANITPNGMPTSETANNQTIELWLSADGQTLEGRTNSTDGTDGNLIYTVQINANGTYDFVLNDEIDNGSGSAFANLSGGVAGNPPFKLIQSSTADTLELLVTPINETSVNSDSNDIAAGSQFIEFNTGIRFDFGDFTYVNEGGTTNDDEFEIESHSTVNGFKWSIDQISNGTVLDVRVTAIDADNDGGLAEPNVNQEGPQTDQIDDITMIKLFDDAGALVATFTGSGVYSDNNGTPGNLADDVLVTVTFNADGSVSFENLPSDYSIQTYTADGYNRIELLNEGTAAPDGKFSVSRLTIETTDRGDPIDLFFDVAIKDADGDSVVVNDGIHVNVDPAGSSSATTAMAPIATKSAAAVSEAISVDSSSLLGSESLDQQLRSMNAANNNAVFLGAVAAAGITAPAAAHNGFSHFAVYEAGASATQSMEAGSVAAIDQADPSALIAKGGVAVQDASVESASSSESAEQSGDQSLDSADGGTETAPAELPEGTDAPAQADPADSGLAAMSVAMPSAEALAAAAEATVDAEATSVDVGQVVADALAGGADGPSIDALIAAAIGHGQAAGHEGLAASPLPTVSAWDTGAFGGFTAGHTASTMDSMIIHPDAAPQSAA